MTEHLMILISMALVTASACQWLAWRVKIPAIVFLMCSGILAGPVLGILMPQELLGELFFPFVSMSVALILFEGSLTLKFEEIRGLETVVRRMVSYGMLVTWMITAIAARVAVGLSWPVSMLFGAITAVSGPTVIVPMLRVVRPTRAVANILRWEGILIDPIGAAMAVLVYEFMVIEAGQNALGHTVLIFIRLVGFGAAVGIVSGYFFGIAIRRHLLPEFLHNLSALSLVIASFTVSNLLQPESGLVAVTAMGVWLANMRDVSIEEILDFKENISMLLISLLFIMLATRLDFHSLVSMGWGLVGLFIAIQFLARPLNVMFSCLGSTLSWPERHLMAWIAPRGIVAAAISALFSVQLEKVGYSDAAVLVPLTFFIIIATVILQSLTARPIASWLGVAEPEPRGFLIVGANSVCRLIAAALMENGVRVLLADTGWEDISKAKNLGLPVYYGNPMSKHAERHMNFSGIGHVLAMSPQENVNLAASMHFRVEFGHDRIFMIQTSKKDSPAGKERMSAQQRWQNLFGEDITFSFIALALSNGADIRTTTLTDKFGFSDFIEKNGQNALPMFAVDPHNNIRPFTSKNDFKINSGWSIIYLRFKADQ